MLANWIVGRECDPVALAEKLNGAPFDVIVVVLTTAVTSRDAIFQHLMRLTRERPGDEQWTAEVVQEKAVLRLTEKVFAVIHRAKVRDCQWRSWLISREGVPPRKNRSRGIGFGTLKLLMDTTRQRHSSWKLGVADARYVDSESHVAALAEWIVKEKLPIVTGVFCDRPSLIGKLATWSGAVSSMPLYQQLEWHDEVLVHPSYFFLFGQYRAISWPLESAEPPEDLPLGKDIWDGMIADARVPWWDHNVVVAPNAPNLGRVKMKPVDFAKWCPHTFQTCVWLGTATPSKNSQAQFQARRGHADDV